MSQAEQNTGPNIDQRLEAPFDYGEFFTSPELDGQRIEILNLGRLLVPSGRIIAADPLVYLAQSLPYTRSVTPGSYDVLVCKVTLEEREERYAAVMAKFSDRPAVEWEMALTEKNEIDDLNNEGDYFGFPVDAGLGSFCDLETQKVYNSFVDSFYQDHPGGNIYDDYFAALFKKNASEPGNLHDIGDWLNFTIPGSEKHNVVMFHSGFGDGYYPCYWGVDSEGNICSLVVDFLVFGPGEDDE